MSLRRIGSFFLGLGVVIGVVGAAALAVGFRPSQLPAALIDISVYKLTFIAAGVVLAAGALVRRSALRHEEADVRARGETRPPGALREGARFEAPTERPEPEPVRRRDD